MSGLLNNTYFEKRLKEEMDLLKGKIAWSGGNTSSALHPV